MVISSLVTFPVEDQLRITVKFRNTPTHATRQDSPGVAACMRRRERRVVKAPCGRTRTEHRHCDANYSAHLSFFRIHRRRSRSVGGVKEERMGWDRSIFSHLVKYLGGTSVECSSFAAAEARPCQFGWDVCARSAGRCALSYCTATTMPSPFVVRSPSVLDVMNKGAILRHIFHALGRLTKGLRKATNVLDAMKCTYFVFSIAKVFHLSECVTAPPPNAAFLLIPSV